MNSQVNGRKRFYIHTLGCKVNQYESQAMREILVRAGFDECSSKEAADICIVNTCTVTAEADRESKYMIGAFRRASPGAQIVATGCLVEKDADDIAALHKVDHIVRNNDKRLIADILNNSPNTQYPILNTVPVSALKITGFKGHSKAYVKIQDGCENRCSYCKVPLVRRELASKPIQDIVDEVEGLVANGFRETILTGICLGAWGKDLFPEEIVKRAGLHSVTVLDALKSIDRIPGDFRIRLSSIEPKYVTDGLIEFMAGNKRMCRHLHIPLQSGDDEILKKMNRPYTAAAYGALIGKARAAIPDIAITTDVLVGFPGESEAHFRNTLAFIRDLAPARAHVFTYSKREGTPACAMGPAVDEHTLKERHFALTVAAGEASYYYRKGFVNKKLAILVETKRDKTTGCLKGYSDNYIKVHFDGPDELMKSIAPVRVNDVSLTGTMGIYGE